MKIEDKIINGKNRRLKPSTIKIEDKTITIRN